MFTESKCNCISVPLQKTNGRTLRFIKSVQTCFVADVTDVNLTIGCPRAFPRPAPSPISLPAENYEITFGVLVSRKVSNGPQCDNKATRRMHRD